MPKGLIGLFSGDYERLCLANTGEKLKDTETSVNGFHEDNVHGILANRPNHNESEFRYLRLEKGGSRWLLERG